LGKFCNEGKGYVKQEVYLRVDGRVDGREIGAWPLIQTLTPDVEDMADLL
jgi:hypothetical protein